MLGDHRYDPPRWANTHHLRTLTKLMADAEQDPQKLEEILSAKGTIIHRCQELEGAAIRASDILRECQRSDGPVRSEIHVLSPSARLARLLCRETAAVLKARVAWHLVRTQADEAVISKTRRLAVLHYSEAVEELRQQLNPARLMAAHFPDCGAHVFTARETFFRLPLATKLKFRERELDLIRSAPLPITDEKMTLHHDLPR